MIYDVIIIGSGPAGISASLYTKRANLETLIISTKKGTLEKVEKIENYYGLKSISGKELNKIGIEQAENLGVEIKQEEVMQIDYEEKYFIVKTLNHEYETKTIIIATGANRKETKIKGIDDFKGKGISYCATCDGFLFRNKDIAVLGSKEYAIHEIESLLPIAKSVTMLTNGEQPIEKRIDGINIDERKIKEFRGINTIEEIEFEDESKKKINGIFIAIGTASSSDLARKLGVKIEEKTNNIIVNDKMETNLKGLYACGDCTGGTLQIAKAVYEGMIAAMSTIQYLNSKEE